MTCAQGGRLRYLHIPKAGSSFAPYVWSYACPLADQPRRFFELELSRVRDLARDLAAAPNSFCARQARHTSVWNSSLKRVRRTSS